MRIAIIAPPFLQIPPTGQGGTEVVVYELTEELVRRGHDVTLFACGKSTTSANYIRVFETAVNDVPIDTETMESSRKLRLEMTYFGDVATRLLESEPFDVVFNHTRGETAMAPLTRFYSTPIISTFHLPIIDEIASVLERNPKAYAIAISENQKSHVKKLSNFVGTCYNGVDTEKFPFNPSGGDYLFWIGTVGRHKNTKAAILAAQQTGKKLVMAGKVRDEDYYEEEIKPLIDGEQIKYVGQISFDEKIPYYRDAKALLFPTLWDEPFGLVAIEALACGTPVVAYPHGALPEIIDDGKNGYLVDSPEAMADAIRQISEIDRATCRQTVKERFSIGAMTDSYLAAATEAQKRVEI